MTQQVRTGIGEMAMQRIMKEVFAEAGKTLKFWNQSGPFRWIIVVDGKRVSDCFDDEAYSFQRALDKSGIGGTIEYRPNPEKETEWIFTYTPKATEETTQAEEQKEAEMPRSETIEMVEWDAEKEEYVNVSVTIPPLTFGKFAGHTLSFVAAADRNYLDYLAHENIVRDGYAWSDLAMAVLLKTQPADNEPEIEICPVCHDTSCDGWHWKRR